jgi:hypothetical protein
MERDADNGKKYWSHITKKDKLIERGVDISTQHVSGRNILTPKNPQWVVYLRL